MHSSNTRVPGASDATRGFRFGCFSEASSLRLSVLLAVVSPHRHHDHHHHHRRRRRHRHHQVSTSDPSKRLTWRSGGCIGEPIFIPRHEFPDAVTCGHEDDGWLFVQVSQ